MTNCKYDGGDEEGRRQVAAVGDVIARYLRQFLNVLQGSMP